MQLHAYLTFNGNCKEAMTFYQNCLGGDLMLQTLGDSPLSKEMPRTMKNYILHATLTKDAFVIHASDLVPQTGRLKGNTVSLFLNCSSEAEINLIYEKLSKNCKANNSIEHTFWGSLFGDLTDKYGNHWLLNYSKKSKS